MGRVRYVSRIPELGPPRGPRFKTLILASAVLVGALAVVLLAGLWGIERGLQERRAVIGDVTFEHYRQGMLQLLDGDVPAARAEFNRVVALRAQTDSPPPLEPTPAPEDSEAGVTASDPAGEDTTPTPGLNQLSLDIALAQIQEQIDAGEWQAAIEQLRTLIDLDPGYQAGLVGQMLFNAYLNQAIADEEAGDLDSAAQALDLALQLRPGNTEAAARQHSIALYREGKSLLGSNWDAAIEVFTELFALDPDFQDTPDQLFLAYAGYGDSLRRSDPCAALERYQLALQIERDPQVRAKLEDARLRCNGLDVASESSQTLAPQSGGPTPTALAGKIAYTYFDENGTIHRTRFWDIDTSAPGQDIADESLQPNIGPEGSIVVRSTRHDAYGITVYDAPGQAPNRLTDQAGDSHPRWSPDGNYILFTSISRTDDRKPHMFIIDVRSGAIEDLGLGQGPDWSPDGQRIVYQGCDQNGGSCGLWLMEIEKRKRRQLTAVESDSMPRWSPDGRLITFMSAGRSPTWDIFVADAATGNIPFFALDDAVDGLPVWSPSGQYIAFLSDREGDWAVYAWSLDDLSVNRLFPVDGPLPAWQEAGMDWAP